MSQPKSNLPVVIGIFALLVVLGGGAYYFTKNMKKDTPAIAALNTDTDGAKTAESGEPAITPEEADEVSKAVAADGTTYDGVTPKEGNPVVAKVDGRDITRVDVFRYIKMLPENVQQLPPPAIYPMAVEQVINTRIVQNKAEDAGLENDPEVQQQLNLAKQQIIRSVYVQRAVDKAISDAELKKVYDEKIGELPDVEEIQASHILVPDEAKAKEIIAKLEEGGDFAKLAAENSSDPGNKDKGGDLGWFSKQDMVPEFADAAFKLGKGEISKTPIKTQFGFHVVKVVDKRARAKPTFAEVKPMLKVEASREKLEGLLADWRKTAKVETFDINGDPVKKAPEVAPAAGEQSAPAPVTEAAPEAATPATDADTAAPAPEVAE